MKSIVVILAVALLVLSCAGGPKFLPIEWIKSSTNDYGYTDENPIRIGYHKEVGANIQLCMKFINCLRNENGERFNINLRGSYADTKYKPEKSTFLGLPIKGAMPKGGMLDGYQLISNSESDTITLFFDIYHAEPIAIPSGLDYVCPTDSTHDPLLFLLNTYK